MSSPSATRSSRALRLDLGELLVLLRAPPAPRDHEPRAADRGRAEQDDHARAAAAPAVARLDRPDALDEVAHDDVGPLVLVRLERRVARFDGLVGPRRAELVVDEDGVGAGLAHAVAQLGDGIVGGEVGRPAQHRREHAVGRLRLGLLLERVDDLGRHPQLRRRVELVGRHGLDRAVELGLLHAREQHDPGDQQGEHYPESSERRRSRSCVSFSSSRGCTIGTSMRAVSPLGLASTDWVSVVPAPEADSS